MSKEVVQGSAGRLLCNVWDISLNPAKPKTSGTIYAVIQLDKPGDANHGQYWTGSSWSASPLSWPTMTYAKGSGWYYDISGTATSGKAGGTIVLVDALDNVTTPASSTVNAGGCQQLDVVSEDRLMVSDIPTASAIATAVRNSMTTELGRIDATISSRSTYAGGAVASVTGNVGGDVAGNILGNLQGNINGSVAGDINGNLQGNVFGSIEGNVNGNVEGKVLGGGSAVLSDVGVRAVDSAGNDIAPASTAVSNTDLTPTRAALLDRLDVAVSTRATPADVLASETAIRGADSDTLETLSDQIDALSATIPLGHGNTTIRTVDEDGDPIDGVRVTVYNMSDTYVTYGYTGGFTPGTGEVHFNLPASAGGISYKAYLYQAGTSFLPESVKTFAVKDPPIGPDFNVFEYEGQLGMSGVMTTFVVVDTATPTPNPVEDVRVRIFSSPADVFLTEVNTDVNGEVSTILEGAAGPAGKEYIIRLTPPSGYSGGPTRTISVIDPLGPSETNVFDFTVYPPSEVPVSLDPDMCKVSGTFTNPSLHPLKNITLIFHPREGYPNKVIAGMPFSAEPTVVRSNIIASDLHVTTDKNGYIEIELPRKSVFDVFVQGLGAGDNTLQASIYIPDMAGIDVREILFPYLTTLTYLTTSLNMTVGDSEEVEVELTASNGQPITGVVALNALLVFASSDPTIALASVGSNGTLVIKALRAGSVTVQASRVVGSFAPRRPEVPDLVIAPSVLTVTVS